jgi:predicted pyridoxine 5'-phosphate oxidase superfamily flavin-nucleotide-binding protein
VTATDLFHDGNRSLQDKFGSRQIADRLEELARTEFSDGDRGFIEESIYFFLGTADAEGRPDVSHKGGPAGFVRVTGPNELAFPDYDGNGMFRSLGNIGVNPNVSLLFIAMHGRPRRLRVVGTAKVLDQDPLLGSTVAAQLMIRVSARAIFPNCPRYIPQLELKETSPYIPVAAQAFVEPEWKSYDVFKDIVHQRHPTYRG